MPGNQDQLLKKKTILQSVLLYPCGALVSQTGAVQARSLSLYGSAWTCCSVPHSYVISIGKDWFEQQHLSESRRVCRSPCCGGLMTPCL